MKEVNRNGDDVGEKGEEEECGNGGVNRDFGINLNKKPLLSPISNFNRDQYVLHPHQMGTPAAQFNVGDQVEVTFERDDSYGVWFPATVIKNLPDNSFLVKYWCRKDGTEALLQKSTVSSSCIRPCSPTHRKRSFVLLDNVDAFYDFAWTSGIIIKGFNDKKFMVSFKRTDNKMVFSETKLRPHMEWVDGRWVDASQSEMADNDASLSKPLKKSKSENAVEITSFTACKTDAAKATTVSKQVPSQEQKTPPSPECQTDAEKTESRSLGDKVSVVADNEASRSRPPNKSKSGNAAEVTAFTACKTGGAKATRISKQDPSQELKTPTSTVCQTDAAATKRHSKVSSSETVIGSLDDKLLMVADNEASRSRPSKKSKSENAAKVTSFPACKMVADNEASCLRPSKKSKSDNAAEVTSFAACKTDAAKATRKQKENPSQELKTRTSIVCHTDAAAPKRPSEMSSSETKSRSLGDNVTRGKNVSGLEKDTTKSCKRRGRPPKILQSSARGGKTAEGTNEIGCGTEHIARVILDLARNGKRSPPDVFPRQFHEEESRTSMSDQNGQGNDPAGLVIEKSPKNSQREQMEKSLELWGPGSTIEIPPKSSEKAKPAVSSDQLEKSSSDNGGKTNVVPYDKSHQSAVDEVSLEEAEVLAVAIDSIPRMDIDENHILPFRKTVALWETIESMEVFKSIPQKPHFRPLESIDEDCCEGFALGHMVTFLNIASKIPKLQVDMPRSSMERSLENLVVLEDHGFDVKSVRDCLNDLLLKKDKLDLLQNDLKEYESQLVESKNKKADIDEAVDEIDKKLEDFRAMREVAVSKREIQVAAIAASQSSVDHINENMKSIQSDFESLVATPLASDLKLRLF